MLELSKRLQAIADRVPQGARLADIGTDHAYLPVWLLQNGRISQAIASDLREGPLSRGKAVAKQWGIPQTQISFRCSDGLRGLAREEVDTIVLAGMGGETIAACLDGVAWSRERGLRYLLQPMSTIAELRRWLGAGFRIEAETLLREGDKRYVILEVTPGSMPPLTAAECRVGRQVRGQDAPERAAYLSDEIARAARVLAGMQQSRARILDAEMAEQAALIADLQQVREEWLSWQA